MEPAIASAAADATEAAIPPLATPGFTLRDDFAGLACEQSLMTIAGFGSLLSETSARGTFPDLQCAWVWAGVRALGSRRVQAAEQPY